MFSGEPEIPALSWYIRDLATRRKSHKLLTTIANTDNRTRARETHTHVRRVNFKFQKSLFCNSHFTK